MPAPCHASAAMVGDQSCHRSAHVTPEKRPSGTGCGCHGCSPSLVCGGDRGPPLEEPGSPAHELERQRQTPAGGLGSPVRVRGQRTKGRGRKCRERACGRHGEGVQGGRVWIHEADREGAARVSRQEPPGGTALLAVAGRPAVRGTRQDARSIGAAHWGLSPTPGTRPPPSLATTLRTWDSCSARCGGDPGLSAPGPETTRTNTLGFQGTRPPVGKSRGRGERPEGSPKKTGRRHQRAAPPGQKRRPSSVGSSADRTRPTEESRSWGTPEEKPQWHSRRAAFTETERNPAEWPGTMGQAPRVCWVLGETSQGQEGKEQRNSWSPPAEGAPLTAEPGLQGQGAPGTSGRTPQPGRPRASCRKSQKESEDKHFAHERTR